MNDHSKSSGTTQSQAHNANDHASETDSEAQSTASLKPGHRGMVRIVKAAGYSWHGIKACYRNEAAFRQELFLLAILTPLSFWLSDNAVEFLLLLGSVVLLLVVELLNTAIEMVVDRHGDEWHELAKLAKDMGSAAVFVMLALMLLVWITLIVT